MAHITITQLNTILSRIVTWVTGKFAAKNVTSGKLEYSDMPVVVLASMGHELDGTDNDISVSVGDTYFIPAGVGTTPRIMYRPDSGNPVRISDPVSGVIYCNAYTGLLYRWDASQAKMVSVGGTSGGSIDVSGKADMLAGTNMLTPLQWPKVVLRNVTDETVDNLASGDVYFDSGHLWLYRGGNQASVDLGAPSNKTIYFCLADGKMYRWVSSSFQPVLSTVAVSGSYNDLSNKPPIPTKISDLTDDSGFLDDEAVDNAIDTALSDYYDKSTINSTFATKLEVEQDLERKQDTLTFDNVPTANSNNPVKSGGIKTALDNLLQNLRIVNNEWYIGNTPTGVSAQGPAGNVNITDASQLVAILVNDLTTGGAGNILSAEMGKVLKEAITTLLDSMGEYCFPLGRPTLSFEGPKCDVTQNLTDVTSDFSALRVDEGGSLEVTLSPSDNLHVFLTGDVTVTMGGTNITSTAWNESTGKVTIASVTDDVVITAKSSTYVQRGLVLHLDAKNGRSVAGRWDSLVNYNNSPLYFKLENCDEQNDYVAGNGTDAKGTAFSDTSFNTPVTLLDVAATSGTIEAAYSHAEIASNGALLIMHNALGSGNRICLTSGHPSGTAENNNKFFFCTAPGIGEQSNQHTTAEYSKSSINAGGVISCSTSSVKFNGDVPIAEGWQNQATNENSLLTLFSRKTSGELFSKLRLHELRVYSVQLTDAERSQNLLVDQKRFNLS